MGLNYLLSVDYSAVVTHLKPRLDENDFADDPNTTHGFNWFKQTLGEHLTQLMSGEPFNEDTVLTDILFSHYDLGVVKSAGVSDVPGAIARVGGTNYLLPFIKIEVTIT